MQDQGRGSMNVYIKVFGTNSSSDAFKVLLYFCSARGITGYESIEVSRSNGTFTATSYHNEQSHTGNITVNASLKTVDGKQVFDASKDRTALANYKGSWGTYKGYVKISYDSALNENLIEAKRYNSFTFRGSGADKNYSISSFSGTSLSDLKFLEAAYKGISVQNRGNSHSYSGQASFQNTHYKNISDIAFKDRVTSYDFSTDTFFTTLTDPTGDTAGLDCSAKGDVTVTMDFTNSAVMQVGQLCEKDRYDNYELCNSQSIQAAWGIIQNYHASQGGG